MTPKIFRPGTPLLITATLVLLCAAKTPAADYTEIGSKLATVIREEMAEWQIGGVAVALIDDQRVVYAEGFGEAKRDSIFRVGSISKLFNAVGVMQQVEVGKLSLDAPLPEEVTPINPYPGMKVTLRQILCHRSGFTRESMVGGYLDGSEPGLDATVASVSSSVLVTRPGEKTRYSNIAPSVAGWMVQKVSGEPFEDYQRKHILNPLGLTNSAWSLSHADRKRIVGSHIRIADGRGGFDRRQTPLFDLGTIPAGNLFSTAEDLGRFASALMAGGRGILKTSTLEQMWQPQLTDDTTGFGLGFMIGRYRDHRTISHNGAVYGHSTSLVMLPKEKIAVVVLGNEDIANGRIHRISNEGLSLMLSAKLGEAAPAPTSPAPVSAETLSSFSGDFESQSYWAHLEVRDGKLMGSISGQPTKFTQTGELKFVADSRVEDAMPVVFTRDNAGNVSKFVMGAQRYERVAANPPALPKTWYNLLGIYGPKFIPLVVSERHGHLYVMTENMVDYRLTPLNRNVCMLPPGMYVDEQAVFLTDKRGRVQGINFANMTFPKVK
jgi:CubicO group peptidase (beta-lactamase class C family)